MGGWCEQATEQEIALAKAEIGAEGVGCEPASAVTLAGLKKLVAQGSVSPASASSSSSPATRSRTRSTPSTTTAASSSPRPNSPPPPRPSEPATNLCASLQSSSKPTSPSSFARSKSEWPRANASEPVAPGIPYEPGPSSGWSFLPPPPTSAPASIPSACHGAHPHRRGGSGPGCQAPDC